MAKHLPSASSVLAASAAAFLALSPACAQQSPDIKDELAQNFAAEHEIGHRYRFDPNDLPPPKTGPIVTDRSLVVPFNGQSLDVPPGFAAAPFVTGLVNPRRLLVLPNGDVLVAEQRAGYLTLLRDDGEGRAKWINRHVEDLNRPYGLALLATKSSSPTRTRSGACRTWSAICAPAARHRRKRPPTCRPISASRCPAPTARSR